MFIDGQIISKAFFNICSALLKFVYCVSTLDSKTASSQQMNLTSVIGFLKNYSSPPLKIGIDDL